MELIGKALLTGLAALLGAWAGAWAALERYRAEKTFDRQVDWYERSARAIGGGIDALDSALFLEREKRFDEAEVYWLRVPAYLVTLGEVAAESDLYAEPNGHQTMLQAIDQLNRIDRDSKAEAKTDRVAARTRMAGRMLTVLRSTRLTLANELRGKLGLKTISATIGPGDEGAA